EVEFRGRIPVFVHFLPGDGDAASEGLDEAVDFQRVRDVGIAVVSDAGATEVLGCDIAVGAAGAVDLDPIIEPVDPDGRVGTFVGAMQDGIVENLLQGGLRVGRVFPVGRGGQDVKGNPVVCPEFFFDLSKHFDQGPADQGFVDDGVGQVRPVDP